MEAYAESVQSSILGPILYDDVLKVPLIGNATTIAFADGLVLVIKTEDKNFLNNEH